MSMVSSMSCGLSIRPGLGSALDGLEGANLQDRLVVRELSLGHRVFRVILGPLIEKLRNLFIAVVVLDDALPLVCVLWVRVTSAQCSTSRQSNARHVVISLVTGEGQIFTEVDAQLFRVEDPEPSRKVVP